MSVALIHLAQANGIGIDLIVKAGGAAGAVAITGMLLVLPLFFSQRREIQRLERWRELEPHRGDSEGTAARVPALTTTATAGAATAARSGELSPLERVTGERPALERITGERPAVEQEPLWRRMLARGPRHPLILSAAAVLLAVAAVVAVSISGQLSNTEPTGGGSGLDRSSVDLVVLNGSSQPSLAGKVADNLSAAGFEQVRTGATGSSQQTVVLFAPGRENRRAARALKRELGVQVIQPLDRATRAAAPGADVVVIAGEDRTKA